MGLAWASRVAVNNWARFVGGAGGPRRSSRPLQLTAVARMGSAANLEPERWEEVLDHLSSMISGKRRADGATWRDAHENMPIYLQRLGIDKEVQKLNVIHVAGTKGKGSTCAMIDSMLRSAGYSTGLFTSPHLCDVRERIRLNGQMVSRPVFADAFWRCYNTLKATATPEAGMPGYFRFLTLLSLQIFLQAKPDVVILEVGIGGRIDATNIIHRTAVTGITSLGFDHMELLGDTLDLIAREKAGIMRPAVPCFTVQQPADAMEALEACAAEVGTELQVAPSLSHFSHPDPSLHISVGLAGDHQVLNASIAVAIVRSWEHKHLQQLQQQDSSSSSNAAATNSGGGEAGSAAGSSIQATAERVQQLQDGVLPLEYCEGLRKATWPGRSQVVQHPSFLSPGSSSSSSRLTFYLDGAHTPESMVTCAQWLAQVTQQQQQQQQPVTPTPAPEPHPSQGSSSSSNGGNAKGTAVNPAKCIRVLVFNCMKERDPSVLLPQLHKELQNQGAHMHVALFVPPDSQYAFLPSSKTSALVAAVHQDLSWQSELRGVWQQCEAAAAAGGHAAAAAAGGHAAAAAAGGHAAAAAAGGHAAAAAAAGGHAAAEQGLVRKLPPLPDIPGVGRQDLTSNNAAVVSCMADVLSWLQQAAAAQPDVQLQVLVTGSLYLVGDCLAGLQQQPS